MSIDRCYSCDRSYDTDKEVESVLASGVERPLCDLCCQKWADELYERHSSGDPLLLAAKPKGEQ